MTIILFVAAGGHDRCAFGADLGEEFAQCVGLPGFVLAIGGAHEEAQRHRAHIADEALLLQVVEVEFLLDDADELVGARESGTAQRPRGSRDLRRELQSDHGRNNLEPAAGRCV